MPSCRGITRSGAPCRLFATCTDRQLCHVHAPKRDCAICLEDIAAPSTLYRIGCPGNHVYHKKCIDAWFLGEHDTCPTCRAEVVNPLPIIRIPLIDISGLMTHVRLAIQDDPTKKASLYFDRATGRLVDLEFWTSEDDEEIVAHIFVDGALVNVLDRWW